VKQPRGTQRYRVAFRIICRIEKVMSIMRSIFDGHSRHGAYRHAWNRETRCSLPPVLLALIGFVHEFHPLDAVQVQELLERRWTPTGVVLPKKQLLVRMAGGNFRLLTRLLTQIERVLSVNDLQVVSTAVIEAARNSLVIGPG
jgi:succinyl-CoA synthetase beta subunit